MISSRPPTTSISSQPIEYSIDEKQTTKENSKNSSDADDRQGVINQISMLIKEKRFMSTPILVYQILQITLEIYVDCE